MAFLRCDFRLLGQRFQLRSRSDATGNVDRNPQGEGRVQRSVIWITSQAINATCDLVNVAPRQFAENSLDSRLRVRQLLEARIGPQRIEHWIEPEQRRSERYVSSQCTCIGYQE